MGSFCGNMQTFQPFGTFATERHSINQYVVQQVAKSLCKNILSITQPWTRDYVVWHEPYMEHRLRLSSIAPICLFVPPRICVLYVYNYVYLDENIFCVNFVFLRVISRKKRTHNVGIPAGLSPKMPDDVIVTRLCKKAFAYGTRRNVLNFLIG